MLARAKGVNRDSLGGKGPTESKNLATLDHYQLSPNIATY